VWMQKISPTAYGEIVGWILGSTVPEPRRNSEGKYLSSMTRWKAECADGCKQWTIICYPVESNSLCIAALHASIDLVITWINTGFVGLCFIICFVGLLWGDNRYLCKTHPRILYVEHKKYVFH
jgi:hypothetical protein